MKKFNVIPLDIELYGIGRWNEVTKQYELTGKTYPLKELAEKAMQNMEDLYNEENNEQ